MTGNVEALPPELLEKLEQPLQQTAEKYTYSDLVIEYLAQIGVEHIFGLQGGVIEHFFNAVSRQRSLGGKLDRSQLQRADVRKRDRLVFPPRPVFARHECGAAFMADGYARETGKLGVCVATAGPGSTNLITGVATAFEDNIPMLVITPQTALPSFGRGGLQESTPDSIDVVAMFEQCTVYNTLVTHPAQLQMKLQAAISRAFQHPRGPAHISIPMDILGQDMDVLPSIPPVATMMREPLAVDMQALAECAEDLAETVRNNGKFVFLLGHGCGEAAREIIPLAERLGANIISTPSGKRWINAYHPLYKGVFGFSGHDSARKALEDPAVERVFAIATKLGETETAGWDSALINEKLVHVEPSAAHFYRSPMARLHLQGHLTTVFKELRRVAETLVAQPVEDYAYREKNADFGQLPLQIEHAGDSGRSADSSALVKPQRLMLELSKKCPSNTRFHFDAGAALLWGIHSLHTRVPGNHRIALGYGTMAWAVGAAVGAAIGSKTDPSVCVTGDGAYLMSAQEITVAVQNRLPVVYVILNDEGMGTIKHGQRLGGAERLGWEMPAIDFAMMARACGANGVTVSNTEDLINLDLGEYLVGDKPTIIDVKIDKDEIPPMGERMKVLLHKEH